MVRCAKHAAEAIGVCVYCGRAMCRDCFSSPGALRLACSAECDRALARDARVMRTLLDKSVQSARASALYCYLCGALSAAGTVASSFMLPLPFLVYFTAGCAVVFVAAGFWYGRVARRHNVDP